MDAFWVWLAQHPLAMAPVVGLLSGLMMVLPMWWLFRKRGDRQGGATVQAVRDMIQRHRHGELSDDFPLVLDRLRTAEANIVNQGRYITNLQRTVMSLQRAVQALQRKAQAEGKPARKPRGKKAQEPQDAWDIISRDEHDA